MDLDFENRFDFAEVFEDDPIEEENDYYDILKDILIWEYIKKRFYEDVENLNKDFPLQEEIQFVDAGEIADWSKEYVSKATQRGLLQGKDNLEFDPKSNLVRAEVAQILKNILDN